MTNLLDICKINFTFGKNNLTVMQTKLLVLSHFTALHFIGVLASHIVFNCSAAGISLNTKNISWQLADSIPFKSERVTQTDSIIVNGSTKTVFPLFGAFEERKWAEGWNPTLLYPATETIAEGTTFKTKSHGFGEPDYTWLVNKYDSKKLFIQYLVISPNRYWTITVQCNKLAGNKTLARVTYSFTGLNETGNHLNNHLLSKMYEHHLKDWEQAINAYLDKQKSHS